ncbi:MAG: hypothetical protein CMH63_00895 [Nanoarchaeota archaeon]|nr:hypothetical protein [Nanoarchaeota archaeon]|tara:strand:- start:12285 stop:12944 length:660 start_codon:yes stop_codon:yes gene_type:complete
MKNAIILCSGGLDSVTAAYKVKDEYSKLKFLFFDYGQRAVKEEEKCCKEIAKRLEAEFIKVELKWLGEISTAMLNKEGEVKENNEDIKNWWVPARNSVFLVNALAFAESEFLKNKEKYDVIIGIKDEGDEHMADTTPEFVKKVNELAKEGTQDGDYEVVAPLIELDKTDVIKLGKELKVPFELTYSCYIENGPCGKCLNCVLRKNSFNLLRIEDKSYAL